MQAGTGLDFPQCTPPICRSFLRLEQQEFEQTGNLCYFCRLPFYLLGRGFAALEWTVHGSQKHYEVSIPRMSNLLFESKSIEIGVLHQDVKPNSLAQ